MLVSTLVYIFMIYIMYIYISWGKSQKNEKKSSISNYYIFLMKKKLSKFDEADTFKKIVE